MNKRDVHPEVIRLQNVAVETRDQLRKILPHLDAALCELPPGAVRDGLTQTRLIAEGCQPAQNHTKGAEARDGPLEAGFAVLERKSMTGERVLAEWLDGRLFEAVVNSYGAAEIVRPETERPRVPAGPQERNIDVRFDCITTQRASTSDSPRS